MKQSKITFLTSLGTGLEHYDFVIYSLLASFISQQFFPGSNHVAALFATFGLFAVGNIVRPLGGIVFGILGDRFGRKNIFANTLLWMAFATVLMGLIPNFAAIGLVATALFSLCRILQGVTFGAEFPGAVTFLSEHVQEKCRGLHFGFMVSAVGLGVSFGSFIIWTLTKILTHEQMLSWGFRLPFLLGGVVAVVGFFIRKHLPETPAFLAQKKPTLRAMMLLGRDHVGQVFHAIGLAIFPTCLLTYFLALPVYLNDIYHYAISDIYLAMTFGYLWSAILFPIFGWFSDYIGRKVLFFVTVLIFILFGFSLFSLLQLETRWALFCFIILGKTISAAMAASYFSLLSQAFPVAIRYTGTALSHNISYSIATLIPLVANYVYEVLKKPNYMAVLFITLAAITAISIVTFKNKQVN
ncbi:MAG: MFS transporter [bacterium]